MTQQIFHLDPKVEAFGEQAYDTPLIQDVWKRYFFKEENKPEHVYDRVAKAIANAPCETNPNEAYEVFKEMMNKRLFLPGGRILAGAGTSKRVTLMNCFVNQTLKDSMEGIMSGVSHLALTMQQGGGMGTSFETLRPEGAILKRTQSAASGPLPFMDMWNSSCKTIRSAGDRRGAMMGTISDTHPDMPAFIVAKYEGRHEKRWAEFNVSVLISEAFKTAVEDDEEWLLHFPIPPVERTAELEARDFVDDEGVTQYVYSVWRARDLWDLITDHTYKYSDPGTIFIDRVNDLNNLSYCEEIRCTNPCGEQPLPPNGTCNLGAINISQSIRNPFTSSASVNYELIAEAAKWGVRFLDNVIEVTGYPLEEQKQEEYNKRRIGLGLTGLGTLLSCLMQRYGSTQSILTSSKIMRTICLAAYDESMRLAEERGKFPLFDDIIVDCGFIKHRLPEEYREKIKAKGLRNGVLLTIAPVGTGSIALGNPSSGLEPDFEHEYLRNVRQKNKEEWKSYTEKSYTKRFYEFCTGKTFTNEDKPEYMATALEIDVIDHIKIQGTLQEWVDASVSKTINVPVDMPYEKFKEVYDLAYMYGCKGCTTFRPTPERLGILSTAVSDTKKKEGRGESLSGNTYKIRWPSMSSSMYVTINYLDEKPYEIFFASKDARYSDWMTGLTLMISSIFRSGIDPSFIPEELKQVISTHDTSWEKGKHYGSLVSRIAHVIEQDFIKHGVIVQLEQSNINDQKTGTYAEKQITNSSIPGELCKDCGAPTLYHIDGCKKCTSCGYSAC